MGTAPAMVKIAMQLCFGVIFKEGSLECNSKFLECYSKALE